MTLIFSSLFPFLRCPRDEAIRHRELQIDLGCHAVIEKLQQDDERASVASNTFSVLPAVSDQVPTALDAVVSAKGVFST